MFVKARDYYFSSEFAP